MADNFDIVEYASSLVGYPVPRITVQRIVEERGLSDVASWADVSTRDKNLIIASILLYIVTSPNDTGNKTKSHGDMTLTVGGMKLYNKKELFAIINRIWENPDQELWEILANIGGCQWMS